MKGSLFPGHKCKPCPEEWMWHDDNCYLQQNVAETWQKSDEICSDYNASLLMIKSKSVVVRSHGSLPVREEVTFPNIE